MNRLKEFRTALGLSQPDVVAKLRASCPTVDVSLYSKFENGHCLPTEKVMKALEDLFRVPRDVIFDKKSLTIIGLECFPKGSLNCDIYTMLKNAIPLGRDKAISRRALASILGTSDRNMRQYIEQARADGLMILNDQDGKGYYRSECSSDLIGQYRQDTNRAVTILRRRNHLFSAIVQAKSMGR